MAGAAGQQPTPQVRAVRWTGQLAERLARIREARGFRSQYSLSMASGVSRDTINRLESGQDRDPSLFTLLRLQRALGLSSIEQLLGPFETFPSLDLAPVPPGAEEKLDDT